METGKLKIFATEARKKLLDGVRRRIEALRFDLESGKPDLMPQQFDGGAVFGEQTVSDAFYKLWMSLYDNVQQRSVRVVAEEAAYTWFNRLMAIRIMSKQGFISPVLDYESDSIRIPLIVTEARQGRLPVMNDADYTRLRDLLDDDNRTAEQFALLIVAYCHSNPVLQGCFGAVADYTELLLPQDILAEGGFVDMINRSTFITDEQYQSAELIGWLYQFYISDRKDEAFAKSGKYAPDDIAPATQIFTPNWIVKYMVQNTVGRIYLDYDPYCGLDADMKYLVPLSGDHPSLEISDVTEIKVADLACGSGHILNEGFDLLYKIYIDSGYSRREAIERIFADNLLGIDIDTRAKQLATFSLMMKACRNDQSFLDAHVMPRVYDMPRPFTETMKNWLHGETEADEVKPRIKAMFKHYLMGATEKMQQELADAVWQMNHADTLGSIMKFDLSEPTRNALMVRTAEYEELLAKGEIIPEPSRLAMQYAHIILALTDKYSAICMNPPYMGSGRFDKVLSKYVKDNYEDSKADLFAVFMQVAIDRLATNGKYGMINMHSWMFLSSFEKLRKAVLETQTIDSLLHLGSRTFDELSGEVVQNAAFVITKAYPKYDVLKLDKDTNEHITTTFSITASYFRLVDGKDCSDKEQMFLTSKDNHTREVYYGEIPQSNFEKIPGSPIGYWVSEKMVNCFNQSLGSVAETREGLSPADVNRFLRLWFEVSTTKKGKKWFPYQKGGSNRKWSGNRDYYVNWENDGYDIKNNTDPKTGRVRSHNYNGEYAFKTGFTWNAISSTYPCFRYVEEGFLFDSAGSMGFALNNENLFYIIGVLNSIIGKRALEIISPTIKFMPGHILKVPYINTNKYDVEKIVKSNIKISREDWDSHETSWDFQGNELVELAKKARKDHPVDCVFKDEDGNIGSYPYPELGYPMITFFKQYIEKWTEKFFKLHANEEKLNRMFIDIYGLQDELQPWVPLDEVTILQQGEVSFEPFNADTSNNYVLKDTHSCFVSRDNKVYRLGYDPRLAWHADVIVKQFISYAVGCMMGRYSIDKPGLILANQGDGLAEYEAQVPNSRFEPDDDGIIPLMSSDTWFNDNATLRFKRFLETVFGEASLNENLNFIEQSLGKTIDQYFVKDFWKDHKKMYQNRPIYWLFSSKKGAFQCMVYMHRMDAFTAERIRSKYLLPHIEWLTSKVQELETAPSLTAPERKHLDSLRGQIDECREYHDRLHTIADRQIAFDLDDGVIVNYAKFGDTLAKLR